MHKAGKYNEVYSVLKVYCSLACRSFLRSFLSVCVLLSTSYIEFAWFSLSLHGSVGQASLKLLATLLTGSFPLFLNGSDERLQNMQAKIYIKFCYFYFSIVPETARLYVWRKNACFFLCHL